MGRQDPTRTYGHADQVGVPTALVDAVVKRWDAAHPLGATQLLADAGKIGDVDSIAWLALVAVQDAYRVALPEPVWDDTGAGAGRALLIGGPLDGTVISAPGLGERVEVLSKQEQEGLGSPAAAPLVRVETYQRHRVPIGHDRRVPVWVHVPQPPA